MTLLALLSGLPRPSVRALVIVGSVAVVLLAAAFGLWWWSSVTERAALSAYADAMTRARSGSGPEATPEARAAAIRDIEGVLGRYPTAGPAPQAALELGNLRYDARQYVRARAAYGIARARGASGTVKTLAAAGIGYAWEAEHDLPKAMAAYRAALAGLRPTDFLYEQLLLDLGRTQELAGQKTAAIETYRRFLGERPGSPRADEVRARLGALGVRS